MDRLEEIIEDEARVTGINVHLQGQEEPIGFDYVLDCTFGHLLGTQRTPLFFEPCLVFVYKSKLPSPMFLGRTVVDGGFVSLMPFWRKGQLFFNLTSVPHTPLGTFTDSAAAHAHVESFTKEQDKMDAKRHLFEEQARVFFRNFDDEYEYSHFYVATKTKLYSSSANRECITDVIMSGRVMQIFGGKITGMFHAEEAVSNWLGLD